MKKRSMVIACIAGAAIMLAACGSSSKSTSDTSYAEMAPEAAYDSTEMTVYTNDGNAADTGSTEVTESAQSTDRKLIRNVSLSMETREYDTLIRNLEAEIKALGGYIENMDASNGNSYYGNGERYASITARIPAASLDDFVSKVGEEANVTNHSESVQDVTLTYVDMASHKKMLQEEQNRLLELLNNAADIEDIITIESRLSEVRYQIESMESQLRTYDNQVDYSTVDLSINEVAELTPIVEESALTRIQTGFVRSLNNVGHGIKEFFVNFVIAIPYLVVWGIVIAVAVLIIRKIIKVSDARTKRLADERRKNGKTVTSGVQTSANEANNQEEKAGYPYTRRPGEGK